MTLTANEERALNEYKEFLLRRFPEQLERLILFGSKARGDDIADSDIDILIILRGKKGIARERFYPLGLTDPAWREMVGATFDILMKHGADISPTIISEDEYDEWSPLTARAKAEGIELWSRKD